MNFSFPKIIEESKRLPNLDGFRCISIALVLFSHSQKVFGYPSSYQGFLRWLPDGGFGVEVFFVISGFLITLLLMMEARRSNRISLKRFYIRRALRIFPAYAAFLMVLAVLQFLSHAEIEEYSWIALLTYLVNYIETPWIGAHVWSLSVEEQFYLVWPFAFWWALVRLRSRKSLFMLALIPIVIAPICRVVGYVSRFPFPLNGYSFLNRADALAIGCLLALLLGTFGAIIEDWIRRHHWKLFLASFACIGIPLVATRLFILGPLTVPFGPTSSAIGIALLVSLSLIHSSSVAYRWLNFRPIVLIGAWSYSIYLWQQIFCTPINDLGIDKAPWWLTFPAWLLPVFATAIVSFYFIEKPFLKLKSRFNA